MLFIDPRVGGSAQEREASLKRWIAGTGGEQRALPFGDFAIDGFAPGGRPTLVGIEFKTVSDLLSSLDTGRFAGHQVPGLVSSYEYRYLLVEGSLQLSTSGRVNVYRGGWAETGWMHQALLGLLDDICTQAGISVLRSANREESYSVLKAVAAVWSKPWEERTGLNVIYTPPPPLFLPRPSQATEFANRLPGFGWSRARAAAKHFGNGLEMASATEKDWREVEGVGKTLAKAAFAAWREK